VAPAENQLHEAEVRLEPLEPGIVPQHFFDQMTSKLSEAVGPMAPLIIRDHIALLGESRVAFPKKRLKELVERVSQEILDDGSGTIFTGACERTLWLCEALVPAWPPLVVML
jgi:hypothetical protein